MSEIPSLPYKKVIFALQRCGFVVVRQRGRHIRLQKRTKDKVIKLTVPAHTRLLKKRCRIPPAEGLGFTLKVLPEGVSPSLESPPRLGDLGG